MRVSGGGTGHGGGRGDDLADYPDGSGIAILDFVTFA